MSLTAPDWRTSLTQNLGAVPLPPSEVLQAGTSSYDAAGAVRCVCGHVWLKRGCMVQCSECKVLQHKECVMDRHGALPPQSSSFLCERCRVELSDPFWRTERWVAPSAMMEETAPFAARVANCKRCSFNFKLSDSERHLLAETKPNPKLQLQVTCVANDDIISAPCRIHWPMNAAMQV